MAETARIAHEGVVDLFTVMDHRFQAGQADGPFGRWGSPRKPDPFWRRSTLVLTTLPAWLVESSGQHERWTS